MILTIFTGSFSPDAELFLIGVRTHTGEYKFWTDMENFLDYFLKTDDKIVVGFNLLKFDIPFLLLKAKDSGKFRDFFRKVNYSNIVDLFTVLTFQNKGVIKGLDFYLEREGIGRNFLSDTEIGRRLQKGEKAEGEVEKKLEAIHSLYWKMKEV